MHLGFPETRIEWIKFTGYFLVFCDAVNWLTWLALSINDVARGDLATGEAAFTALASPHVALTPAILGIIFDIDDKCKGISCTPLSTPPFTWFMFPLYTLPFDILQYIYNSKIYSSSHFALKMSIFSICISGSMTLWSFSTFKYINNITPKDKQDRTTEEDTQSGKSNRVGISRAKWNGLGL